MLTPRLLGEWIWGKAPATGGRTCQLPAPSGRNMTKPHGLGTPISAYKAREIGYTSDASLGSES